MNYWSFLWHPKSAETFKEKNKNFIFLEILKFQHNATEYIESQTNKWKRNYEVWVELGL